MNLLTDPFIILPTYFGLCLLLFSAAFHKLRSPERFSHVLTSYGVAPGSLNLVLQWTIPFIELLMLMALINVSTRKPAAILICGLFLIYALIMAITLRQGKLIGDCGCSFGRSANPVSPALVWRNLFLALITLNLVQPATQRHLSNIDIISIVVITCIGITFYLLANILITTQHSSRDLFHD